MIIKQDCDKRKRQRNSSTKTQGMLASASASVHKHHKTSLETRKQDIYTVLDAIQKPGTTNKQETVQSSVQKNLSDIPSNRL